MASPVPFVRPSATALMPAARRSSSIGEDGFWSVASNRVASATSGVRFGSTLASAGVVGFDREHVSRHGRDETK